MDALYHQTNRLLQEVAGDDLGKIERLPGHADRSQMELQVEDKLHNVNR